MDRDVIALQTEWLVQHRTHRRVSIVAEPAGWSVHEHTEDGVGPPTLYPTPEQAAARLLQLLGIVAPISPQDWPEAIRIESIHP